VGWYCCPGKCDSVQTWDYAADKQIHLKQGDEMGHFRFGSTVIMLLPENSMNWQPNIKSDSFVQLGQVLGQINS
jgi:phosphatidylserine decarboxylase